MSGKSVKTETVTHEEAGARLDRWIKRRMQVTQGEVEKLLRTGQIRVDGGRAKSNTRLEAGQAVRLPPQRRKADAKPGDDFPGGRFSGGDQAFMRDMVLYEDEDLFVLNKPPGFAVQGGTNTYRHVDGMLGYLRGDSEHRPKLVHRLDKDTSGVLAIAKHPAEAARLGELFRGRSLDKVYWAVTIRVPQPRAGQVRCWMARGTGEEGMEDRERMYRSKQGRDFAKHAISDYAVVSTAGQKAAWVALKPITGRTHQLRFHMAELDTAILGDDKYTTRREVPQGVAPGLHLHARALTLPRARGKPITITAPLPWHMKETFETLGFLESEAGRDPLDPFL
ncbi:MAG: RluA family pseudouridine synthase [Pseudomonadota bacterium]